jgi:hypothetical protein
VSESPSLPHLSDDQLTQLFGGDAVAIRRYLILSSIFHSACTQREAALSRGVSERTVRNVLQAYSQNNTIESLRSRPVRGVRAPARQRLGSEQALATALQEEPQAGGDRLWRRAQELLGDAGHRLSRRTAYRILERLRDEGSQPDTTTDEHVRAALPLLLEDPPLSLGATGLARMLLPHEHDGLLRGAAIQQALRAALDRLRPAGEVSTVDREWWPYLICIGEYESGQSRAELQKDLALSASTYSRSKRQGLARVAALLPALLDNLALGSAPPVAHRLPRVVGFVGRHDEQAYYAWRLQTEGRAYVWGLPGSGKTALATELAAEGQRFGQTILWHTCRPGRDTMLAGVLRGLARELAAVGDTALWQALRGGAGEQQSNRELLDLLHTRLVAHPAVIVLDDAHRLDPDTEPLMALLNELAASGSTRLLIVGRVGPEQIDWPALPSLAERDARLLWIGSAPLAPDDWEALYQASGGLPKPLAFAAAMAKRGSHIRLADMLSAIERWHHEAIWTSLSRGERRVLAAICSGQTAAAALLAAGEAPQTLTALARRQLAADDTILPIHIALRRLAQSLLRDDTELRLALSAPISEVTPEPIALEETIEAPRLPASMELVERLHELLEKSSRYLQGYGHDQHAQLIAAELVQLRDALPAATMMR